MVNGMVMVFDLQMEIEIYDLDLKSEQNTIGLDKI